MTTAISTLAETFFAEFPSREAQDEAEIRKFTDSLIKGDPNESDDAVYANNSWREAPFHPEVDRFGGPELLDYSLELFEYTSCRVLRFLHEHGGDPRGKLFPFALRLLVRLGLGFVRDTEELLKIFRYPAQSWKNVPLFAERGDQAFENQKEQLSNMLRREIEDLLRPQPPWDDPEAACRFSAKIDSIPRRMNILCTHLHLTANRLGIPNAQEYYLMRILWRAVSALADEEPLLWEELAGLLEARAAQKDASPEPAAPPMSSLCLPLPE